MSIAEFGVYHELTQAVAMYTDDYLLQVNTSLIGLLRHSHRHRISLESAPWHSNARI